MDIKAYESVVGYTKSEILSGRLKQGQKLPPERELAAKIGVGRTSVREALRVMEMLGLIYSVQGSGNFISANFEKSITETLSMMFLLQQTNAHEINEVRACLELKAAELAIDNITDDGINNLREIIQKMGVAECEETEASLDKQLHFELASASNNTILIQMLNAMSVLTENFIRNIRKSILSDNNNRERLKKIHRDITDAVANRDKEAVRKALSNHSGIIYEYLENVEDK